MPLVSVIVPVYKSVNVLEKAVNSVLSQSFKDFEIVLVDDGSPDKSLELCNELASRDSRIKVFHKENGGICSARNYGIEHSLGEYIAFLDHDDEYMPGYLEDNVKLLESYKADFIKFGKNYRTFDSDGKWVDHHDDRMLKALEFQDGVATFTGTEIQTNYPKFRSAVKAMFIWDVIYNADFINSNNIRFDPSFKFGNEDNLFNIEAYKHAKSIVFNSKEYYIHNFDDNFSTSAVFNYARVEDSIRTAISEGEMLSLWNVPSDIILEGYMDELFRLLNILNNRGGKLNYSEKKKIIHRFSLSTVHQISDIKKAIKALYSQKKSTGIWAWCLYHKMYLLVFGIEKAYRLVNYR